MGRVKCVVICIRIFSRSKVDPENLFKLHFAEDGKPSRECEQYSFKEEQNDQDIHFSTTDFNF